MSTIELPRSTGIQIIEIAPGFEGVFASEHHEAGKALIEIDITNPLAGTILPNQDRDSDECCKYGIDFYREWQNSMIGTSWVPNEITTFIRLNSSCNANAAIGNYGLFDQGKFKIVALRDIQPGEQITFDYSPITAPNTRVSDIEAEMTCLCGDTNCRGIICAFDKLAPELKIHFVQQRAVLAYILQYPGQEWLLDYMNEEDRLVWQMALASQQSLSIP